MNGIAFTGLGFAAVALYPQPLIPRYASMLLGFICTLSRSATGTEFSGCVGAAIIGSCTLAILLPMPSVLLCSALWYSLIGPSKYNWMCSKHQ